MCLRAASGAQESASQWEVSTAELGFGMRHQLAGRFGIVLCLVTSTAGAQAAAGTVVVGTVLAAARTAEVEAEGHPIAVCICADRLRNPRKGPQPAGASAATCILAT